MAARPPLFFPALRPPLALPGMENRARSKKVNRLSARSIERSRRRCWWPAGNVPPFGPRVARGRPPPRLGRGS
eukprot:8434621-Pyramimonas_sp.AAC.1